MILYLDASSLVKLYVDEAGSVLVRDWCDEAQAVATCAVAYVEAMAAVARLRREGGLDDLAVRQVVKRLDDDWPAFVRPGIDVHAAGAIADRHPLRALDAIHVAAALALGRATGEGTVTFATFDARQGGAARAEGLAVVGV